MLVSGLGDGTHQCFATPSASAQVVVLVVDSQQGQILARRKPQLARKCMKEGRGHGSSSE